MWLRHSLEVHPLLRKILDPPLSHTFLSLLITDWHFTFSEVNNINSQRQRQEEEEEELEEEEEGEMFAPVCAKETTSTARASRNKFSLPYPQ